VMIVVVGVAVVAVYCFLQQRHNSYQRMEQKQELLPNYETNEPWKPAKKDIPDISIDPRDISVVLVLNAGEITYSSSFPWGITLWFPLETSKSLWEIYSRVETERGSQFLFASINGGCLILQI
jgi:hypothetical protein